MNSDLLTKPVQGEQAQVLHADIMNLPAPSVTTKLTKPLPIALPLQGMPAWMFTQTPRKVAFCNMNVTLPMDTDDDNADEADDDDDEDEEPSSPERECSPSLDEPPVVAPAPVLLDRHLTIWIQGNVTQQGPIPEPMLHPVQPRHCIHPDDTNLYLDFHMDLNPPMEDPLPPPTTTPINWDAFCNLNNQVQRHIASYLCHKQEGSDQYPHSFIIKAQLNNTAQVQYVWVAHEHISIRTLKWHLPCVPLCPQVKEMYLSHHLRQMNNNHSRAQYGYTEDDNDWNIMVHRRHSTDTTCTLHDFIEETTTVWNFVTRTIHSTEWTTDRTCNQTGGLLSGRITRKESITMNIALNSWGWPGSLTHSIFTPQVDCISPPPHLKPKSPPKRATTIPKKISNLQPSVPGQMRATMIHPRLLDCQSVLKIHTGQKDKLPRLQ